MFPGHALHEKDLQRKVSVGTLVSSQDQRAFFVLRIYGGQTAGFDRLSVFQDMPCMKRVYRGKIDVSTLASSKERQALFVPRINRLSTAYQLRVNLAFRCSVCFMYKLDCSYFRRVVQDKFLDLLKGKREGYLRAGSTQ